MNHKRLTRVIIGCAVLLGALTLLTCEKIPDYCGKGSWYDPGTQFCFALKPYNMCGGSTYNPLTQGCINGATVGTRCADNSVVPFGTPCDGYALTTAATPVAGGDITRTPDATHYSADESVVISANPADGYTFVGWAGAITSKAPTITVTMDGNKPMVAMFKTVDPPGSATRTLAAAAFPENGGTITREPEKNAYATGEKVTITATALSGYTFAGWTGDTLSQSNTITITMDVSKTLVAMFTPSIYTVTVNTVPADAGAVFVNRTAQSGNSAQSAGTVIELLAVPEEGYTFSEWLGAAAGMENPATVSVTSGDLNATAVFKPGHAAPTEPNRKTYTVTNIIGSTGVSFSRDYAEGENVPLSAGNAPEGQEFKGWTVYHAGERGDG